MLFIQLPQDSPIRDDRNPKTRANGIPFNHSIGEFTIQGPNAYRYSQFGSEPKYHVAVPSNQDPFEAINRFAKGHCTSISRHKKHMAYARAFNHVFHDDIRCVIRSMPIAGIRISNGKSKA